MNANDVIDAYITDVALCLPRGQRSDVACELRALIDEGLQAGAAGRGVDAARAVEFLREFGRPADVAARYGTAPTIIDPSDSRRFLRATIIGMAIIWGLGLVASLRHGADFLGMLAHWWTRAALPSLWWPGLLVVGFGGAAWVRRRWPRTAQWTPRAPDRLHGGRAAMLMALAGIVCGLLVLLDPTRLLDLLYDGRAAPAAYAALTYTDAFRQRQAPILLALLSLNVPLFIAIIAKGRWSAALRRAENVLGLLTCAVVFWTIADGPVLMADNSNDVAKSLMALIVAFVLIAWAIELRRKVRPMPRQALSTGGLR